ncbi:MAG: hypothetical protein R3B90_21020 [Planctomycetaceae bacterium]
MNFARAGLPIKERYRSDPAAAACVLTATGELDLERIGCVIVSGANHKRTGLHPGTGGDGSRGVLGGDAAGVAGGLRGHDVGGRRDRDVVAAEGGRVIARGEIDFRGTLGVSREVAIGFTRIEIEFDLEGDLEGGQRAKLLELTEPLLVVRARCEPRPSWCWRTERASRRAVRC